MAQHGGSRAPDGRQAQAPGIGKDSVRSDLALPATPGLAGSDLQQGDVQDLEDAQRIAPRAGAPNVPRQVSKPRRQTDSQIQAPDPIDFIGGRDGGQPVGEPDGSVPLIDPTPWLPFIQTVATAPGSGGAVANALVKILTTTRDMPMNPQYSVLDRQELDDLILNS